MCVEPQTIVRCFKRDIQVHAGTISVTRNLKLAVWIWGLSGCTIAHPESVWILSEFSLSKFVSAYLNECLHVAACTYSHVHTSMLHSNNYLHIRTCTYIIIISNCPCNTVLITAYIYMYMLISTKWRLKDLHPESAWIVVCECGLWHTCVEPWTIAYNNYMCIHVSNCLSEWLLHSLNECD